LFAQIYDHLLGLPTEYTSPMRLARRIRCSDIHHCLFRILTEQPVGKGPSYARLHRQNGSIHLLQPYLLPSDLTTVFAWETPSPFSMTPEHGVLSVGAECTVKVLFQPKAAAVCNVIATCWFGVEEKQKRTMQLRAQG